MGLADDNEAARKMVMAVQVEVRMAEGELIV
jgi:hypothetical protein